MTNTPPTPDTAEELLRDALTALNEAPRFIIPTPDRDSYKLAARIDRYFASPPKRAVMISALASIAQSCRDALEGRWDRSDDGFTAMLDEAEAALRASEGGAP
jgi:hypothetical protein